MSKNKQKVSLYSILKFTLKINLRVVPIHFFATNSITFIRSFVQVFITISMQAVFDSVEGLINNDTALNAAYFAIVMLGLTYIMRDILDGVNAFIRDEVNTKIMGEYNKLIHKKISSLNPLNLEDTKCHEDIVKATNGAGTIQYMLETTLFIFVFYIPYFTFMGIYLSNLKPIFILAILMVFLPVMLCQFIRTGVIAKFEDVAAPIRREFASHEQDMVGSAQVKETRKLGAFKFFKGRYMAAMSKLSRLEIKMNDKRTLLDLFMGCLSAAGYLGILFMLINALLAGDITVGAFAAVFASIGMLFNSMSQLVQRNIGSIASNMGTVRNFIRFMEMQERGGSYAEPDFSKGIVAKNISFTYPNSAQKSVDNVSINIKLGETVAIVGVNGAGKSTLVRLLIGIYTPTEGKVILNGMDTTEVNEKSLFKGVSGVFQKYQKYAMSLKDNICISDFESNTDIGSIANQAGVEMDTITYPQGAETMLSREYEGVELSGGQWQRVAIARGLYRAHNLVILDEPTAAIDPIEESRIYHKFLEVSKDTTSILVTHRLGSARIADWVIMMDSGRIIESGTHDALMRLGGKYKEMFISQASWYEDTRTVEMDK